MGLILRSSSDLVGHYPLALVMAMEQYLLSRFTRGIYLGTTNWYRGFGVYRSSNGINFTKVGTGGFGDKTNAYAWRFEVFEDALWLGVMDRKAGEKAARLWCTFDGTNWSEMVGPSSLYASEGSGNLNNRGIRTLDMYRGKL